MLDSLEMLETTDAVIDAVGGTSAAAGLFGFDPRRVSNWRKAGRFPPETFLVLTAALRAIGKTAPSTLWSMHEPAPLAQPAGASA